MTSMKSNCIIYLKKGTFAKTRILQKHVKYFGCREATCKFDAQTRWQNGEKCAGEKSLRDRWRIAKEPEEDALRQHLSHMGQ